MNNYTTDSFTIQAPPDPDGTPLAHEFSQQQNSKNSIYEQALELVKSGLSIIPIRTDGSKAPAINSWKQYQERLPDDPELSQWFENRQDHAIAIVCGEVSNNIIVYDFEYPDVFEKFRAKVEEAGLGELLKKFPWVRTGGGGNHVVVRLNGKPPGGEELARRPTNNPKKPDLLLETRGEGNYVVAVGSPASAHKSGKSYLLLNGDLSDVPVLGDDIFDFFIELGKTFDEMPQKQITQRRPLNLGGSQLGDYFNHGVTWAEVLEPHGFKLERESNGEGYWQKPNSSNDGHHITTNYANTDLLFCFSTNAPPFETKKPYNKFTAYAVLNHDGDTARAQADLEQQGFSVLLPNPQLDDIGNSERLLRMFSKDISWVQGLGWLVWTGTHWEIDVQEKILAMAKKVARNILTEVPNE